MRFFQEATACYGVSDFDKLKLKIASELGCAPNLDHNWTDRFNSYSRCSKECINCRTYHDNCQWIEMIVAQNIKRAYWDVSKDKIDKDLFKNIGQHLKLDKSILIQGNVGSGKTYLMHCLLKTLGSGELYKAYEIDDLILSKIKEDFNAQSIINKFQQLDFLFIDDLGVNRFTERFERDFYSIIDDRLSDLKPTIISTNLSDKDLNTLLGERLFSRLKEYIRIEYNYPDRRGR